MAGTAGLLQTIIRTNNSLHIGLFCQYLAPFCITALLGFTLLQGVCQLVMPRCRECRACLEVVEAREKYKGGNKALQKKLKRIEWKNPCEDPQKTTKKQRINEADNLNSAGHGGEIRGEVNPPLALSEILMDPPDRASRPGNLSESPFSSDADFDEYLGQVLACQKIADESRSPNVLDESKSMITKMRGLLTPQLRDEVDYKEATKDCSNIAVMWLKNEAAGTRAFIPDVNDRDQCYAALKIYSCALEESNLIPTEFVEVWGEDGYWVYKTMLDNIGSRERASLPFVNMCLRSWMLRLLEDGELWPNLDTLDYDD